MRSIKKFQNDILEWWKQNKRTFPWRQTNNIYELLIAELLLRKTTAEQVNSIYTRILEKYPTPEILCKANEKELQQLLKPLGMQYSRSKLLKKLACYLSKLKLNEAIDIKQLKQLPGVGPYTANAVLCMLQNEPIPMVDTNVIRILKRVFGIKSQKKRPRNDPLIWKKAKELIPEKNAKEFNLALIDFASLICKAGKPKCENCFAKDYCQHFSQKL